MADSGPSSGGKSRVGSDVRERQADAIRRMLNYNKRDEVSSADWSDDWKVLVYDTFCRDIIGPLLSVNELRKSGVTLHLLMDSPRDAIAGVAAVYFVQPTEANVRRIVKDLEGDLYDRVYLNFASPLPRPLLEMLAAGALEVNRVSAIAKVVDQHLGFSALESDMFSLCLPRFYTEYSSPKASGPSIEAAMNSAAQAIFSVCVTMRQVPIIRAPTGGPAEMVARKVEGMLRDNMSLFPTGAGQRPALVLLDRNIDLAVMMAHTSTYRALLADTLEFGLNRVTVEVKGDGGSAPEMKVYDLDSKEDAFWAEHAGQPFPETIAANGQELAKVREQEAEIRSKTAASAAGADSGSGAVSAGTEDLAAAVDSLQPLLNRKKVLEMHTNILQGVMSVVASRHIPTFFETEQALLQGRVDKAAVFELLHGDKGSPSDKLRLASIYYLAVDASVASTALDELSEVFKGSAGDGGGDGGSAPNPVATAAINYLKSVRMVAAMTAPLASGPASGDVGGWLSGLDKFAGHATDLLAKATTTIKTLLPSSSKLPVTRIVDAICEGTSHELADTFVTLDPKLVRGASVDATSTHRSAIVVMLGGGNYSEYQNLQDYAAKQTPPKDIVYGGTDICVAEQFCDELAALGGFGAES